MPASRRTRRASRAELSGARTSLAIATEIAEQDPQSATEAAIVLAMRARMCGAAGSRTEGEVIDPAE